MTTNIQLPGSNFSRPGLPYLTEMDSRTNAMFRPYAAPRSLVDLSGEGHKASPVGSPIFTDVGLRGDNQNGYSTDVAETVNLTMFIVARTLPQTDSFNGFPAGNWVLSSGIGFYVDTDDAGVGNINVRLKAGFPGSGAPGLFGTLLVNVPKATCPASPWFLAAIVVTDTGLVSYRPKMGTVAPISADMANRPISAGNKMKLLLGPFGSPAFAELAHFSIAPVAFSQADVLAECDRIKASLAFSRPSVAADL